MDRQHVDVGRPLEHGRSATLRALVALALACSVTACSLGDKQERADSLHRSVDLLRARTVVATIGLELELDTEDAPVLDQGSAGDLAAFGAAGGGPGAAPVDLAFVAEMEPAERVAAVTIAGEDERSSVVFDTDVYVRRQNARDTERRRWAHLDVAEADLERPLDLEALEPPALLRAVAATVNPMYLVELLEGALAGSVELRGDEQVGATTASRYDFNLSFDKALTELDFGDDERATRLGVFRQFGATKDVVPASAWLDGAGQLVRFQVELPVRVSRLTTHHLTVIVDVADADRPEPIQSPDPEETVDYETFGRLGRAALPARS